MNDTLLSLQFTPVAPELRDRYAAITAAAPSQSADHSFVNLCIWHHVYRQEIAFVGNRAAVRFATPVGRRYLFPIGTGPLAPVVESLLQTEPDLTFSGLTEKDLAQLLADFPDTFATFEDRDIADYLYDAESLATLSGKKLHGKRNHINAFTAANEWYLKELGPEDADACRHIQQEWQALHPGDAPENERVAMEYALTHREALGLYGALLYANGAPVAFTLGSMLTPDTLCVHFEKALSTVQGAYPTVNREFVRMMREKMPALRFVNREDDMGLESLRKAKLSYRPLTLIRKFTAKRV